MITIIKYKAIDGKEFNDSKDCMDYENLINRVNEIMKPMLNVSDNYFVNNDYIQFDLMTIYLVKINLLKEIQKHINHKWIQENIDNKDMHVSYVGRLLDDYDIKPFYNAWYIFMCIDKFGRQWQYPYKAQKAR